MTNQEKFVQIFGRDAWLQMIVFSGLAKQFKEYWTSLYNNDLPHCQHSDEEIAKSFIEDVEAVKGQLDCECKDFESQESEDK